MDTKHFVENRTLVALEEQLHAVAQQVRSDMDVAPSQRLRLEGFAAALIAGGADIDALEQVCVAACAGTMTIMRDGDRLRFDCWQKRAPVYPTTVD